MGIYDHEEYSGFTWKDQGISVFAIDGLIRRLMGEIVEAERLVEEHMCFCREI